MSTELATTKSNWMAPESLEGAWRLAKGLALSAFVPEGLRAKDAETTTANVLAVISVAAEMGISPIALFQHTHVIHGKVGFSSAFLIARANASGRFRGGIRFEMAGDPLKPETLSCRAVATLAETGDVVEGPLVTWAMAKAEGWTGKNGSKWQTMPELMFRYRAGTFFVRLYAGDTLLGALRTDDEVRDMEPIPVHRGGAIAALVQSTVRPDPRTEADRLHRAGAPREEVTAALVGLSDEEIGAWWDERAGGES